VHLPANRAAGGAPEEAPIAAAGQAGRRWRSAPTAVSSASLALPGGSTQTRYGLPSSGSAPIPPSDVRNSSAARASSRMFMALQAAARCSGVVLAFGAFQSPSPHHLDCPFLMVWCHQPEGRFCQRFQSRLMGDCPIARRRAAPSRVILIRSARPLRTLPRPYRRLKIPFHNGH
jgi:hypothetical protein